MEGEQGEIRQNPSEASSLLKLEKPINIELTPINIHLRGFGNIPMVVDACVGDDGRATPQLVLYLKDATGKITEQRVRIPEQGGTIGREGSLVKLEQKGLQAISRHHLIVSTNGNLKDNNSTNGTQYSPVKEPEKNFPLNPGRFYKLPKGEKREVSLGPVSAEFSVNKEEKQLTINIGGQTLSLSPGVYQIGRDSDGLKIWQENSSRGVFKNVKKLDGVSRSHAALVFDGQNVYIMDLGSTNKTRVDIDSGSLETRKGDEKVKKISVSSSGDTDQGPRKDNEDAFYVGNHNHNLKQEFSLPSGVHLAIIADGMGGLQNGEEASKFTIEKLLEIINQTAYSKKLGDINEEWLKEQVGVISSELKGKYQDAGTTLTFVLTVDEKGETYIVSIGDSRAYLIDPNENTASLLTSDQSLAWKQFKSLAWDQFKMRSLDGFFKNEFGLRHLTSCLGKKVDEIQVVRYKTSDLKGKVIVLVTDGVWNAVPPEAINEVGKKIDNEDQLKAAFAKLFLSYNLAGLDLRKLNPYAILKRIEEITLDNATAVVVRFD